MSITIVFILSAIFSAGLPFFDDSVYSDNSDDSDDPDSIGLGKEWIDEALLDVAFYLRLHKFGDFDRRYEH